MPHCPSPDQLAVFKQDGYVLIPALFYNDEMNSLLRYTKGDEVLAGGAYVREDATGGQSRIAKRTFSQ